MKKVYLVLHSRHGVIQPFTTYKYTSGKKPEKKWEYYIFDEKEKADDFIARIIATFDVIEKIDSPRLQNCWRCYEDGSFYFALGYAEVTVG